MSIDDVRYKARRFKGFPIDRRHALLVSSSLDAPITVLGAVPFMLHACLTPRTLNEHEQAVMAQWHGADPAFVRSTLERLVRAGLLEPVSVARRDERTGPRPELSVSTLGVLTADRPQTLERCLTSYIRNCQAHDRHLRVIVLDGSLSAAAAERNRLIAHEAHRRFGYDLRYIGPDEKGLLRAALAARGAHERLLEFAMPDRRSEPASSGGDRTALLLLTVGERVLMVDDATVCTPWVREVNGTTLELCGHADPRKYEFFESREAACPPTAGLDKDLIAAHEALLGRSLFDLIETARGDYDAGGACAHMFRMLMDRIVQPRVLLTCSGVAGDSGLVCPYRLLFADGQVREALASDQDIFDRALTFRELRRVCDRPAVTHDAMCELHCAALDNTSLLPPFPSLGMDAAASFVHILAQCDPATLLGHVPCAVVYDSERPAVYETAGIVSASTVGLADVVVTLASSAGASPFLRNPANRMPHVGEHLSAIAGLSLEAFGELLRDLALERKCGQLAHIDELEAKDDAQYPDYWKAAFARYRLAALAGVENRDFFLPSELAEGADLGEGLRRTRAFLADFGALLQSWPETVAAAGDLASDIVCRA